VDRRAFDHARPRRRRLACRLAAGQAATLLRARAGASAARLADAAMAAPGTDDWLVVHASQTGQAAEIAQRTAALLASAGAPVQLRGIDALEASLLARTRRVLFVASTTGEGDPPDAAARFVRAMDATGATPAAALAGVQYAILALGDRRYRNYCAFGHVLGRWLHAQGATPLFDLVEVDNADPAALRHWQHLVGTLAGATALPDWAPPAFEPWTLASRHVANPGSSSAPVFDIRLLPPPGGARWQAGDIAEVGPRQAPAAVAAFLAAIGLDGATPVQGDGGTLPLGDLLACSQLPAPDDVRGMDATTLAARLQALPSREYSIASIPAEGHLGLLLRRILRPDGTPGVGSGWLCDHAAPGSTVALRVRANPAFHRRPGDAPLLLVGNGTGIAGLRAHLAERIANGHHRNWLVFGERSAAHDALCADDLAGWLAGGGLAHLDLAFSRDTAGLPAPLARAGARVHAGYVQGVLRGEAARLSALLAAGGSILVCGSLRGMAPGVDAVLRDVAGDASIEAMLADGRYRRDVY
jgi:sulfite reductase (NADPH) flavoprotein alpha-component